MPYKFKPGGYPIPEVIEVGGRRCIQFEVPDDPRYIAAATGAITSLGNWWVWDKTKPGDRRATETAAFIRGILADTLKVLEECGEEGEPMPVYTIDVDGCSIVLKADGITVSSVDLTDPELADCLPEGPAGPQGPAGPPGEPGDDGQSPDFPTETPGVNGDDKRCDIASYLSELVLPTLNQQVIAAREDATNNNNFIAALLVLPAAVITSVVTAGAAVPAWMALAAAGAAAGGAALAVTTTYDEGRIADINQEATPQFWQDVKCEIHCVIPDDGIITADVLSQMVSGVQSLADTYPNAAPAIASLLTAASEDARGFWSVRGSLYEGSNCEICDCIDFCAPQKMHWVDIGATPTGWTSVSALPSGITNPHGFSSELMLNLYGVPSQGTRSANTNWTVTRQAVVALAVKYEFPEPCDVIDLYVAATQGGIGNNTKYIYIVVEMPDGENRLIKAAKANAGSLPTISLKWEGDPLTVKAVYYMMRTGGGTVNHTITMHDNEINEGLL